MDEDRNADCDVIINNSETKEYADHVHPILCGFILEVIKHNKNSDVIEVGSDLQTIRNGFINDNISTKILMKHLHLFQI